MTTQASPKLQQRIIELVKNSDASLAGITCVEDLKSSRSNDIYQKDPYNGYFEALSEWPDDALDALQKKPPFKRIDTPEGDANLYLFLASDEANYISGEGIRIAGGMVIGTYGFS
jgi:NAD(P)-dependent dehydrogenase (short-subunit alcohol dehydrogenase family)